MSQQEKCNFWAFANEYARHSNADRNPDNPYSEPWKLWREAGQNITMPWRRGQMCLLAAVLVGPIGGAGWVIWDEASRHTIPNITPPTMVGMIVSAAIFYAGAAICKNKADVSVSNMLDQKQHEKSIPIPLPDAPDNPRVYRDAMKLLEKNVA